MTIIAVDGLSEEAFRRSIESRLRRGLAKEATAKLRGLLAPYAGPGLILPDRFLKVLTGDLNLTGWEKLGEALIRHDQPERHITAISIAFGWPGENPPQPDAQGLLAPTIETSFFTDEAFAFSQSSREDLLDGYSYHGCSWSDESVGTDQLLALEGIDDLHGALAALETRLLNAEVPDDDEIRAGSLGSCLLSALLFQAVGERIARDGLPRPLCVLAGSNGVYPYFDAPVAGISEEVLRNEELLNQVPTPRYSSLLVTGIPRARKRAVLVLDESDSERELRTADLRNLAHGAGASTPVPEPAEDGAPLPPQGGIIPVADGPLMAKKKPIESWDFRDMLSSREQDLAVPDEGPEEPWPEPATDRLRPEAAPEPEGWPETDWLQPVPEPEDPPETDWHQPAADQPATEPELPEPDLAEVEEAQSDAFDSPDFDPGMPPLPGPVWPEPVPGPGFALLETSVRERLDALVAAPMPRLAKPELPELLLEQPAPDEPAAEELVAISAPQTLPEGPVWCLGIGYLEDAEDAAASAGQPVQQAADSPGPSLWTRLRGWLKRR